MDVLLCGDIGGTHTRLALVRPGQLNRPIARQVFASRDFPSVVPMLERFWSARPASKRQGMRLRGAAFGIPGPVSAGTEELWMVNLPWRIHVSEVAHTLNLPRVRFINDFTAVALAVPHLTPRQRRAIGEGAAQQQGPIAVIGAGTGLGEGFLVWHGSGYLPIASEGGHSDFAPRTPLEVRLLEYLRERLGPVSWESVVSGPGLVNLVEFFRDREGMTLPSELANRLQYPAAREAAPALITRLGQGESADPACARAVELFCTLYGAEAGNLAVKVVATGGVYMAGGVAQHLLDTLNRGGFRAAFIEKQGFANFLRTIPTWVITHPNPGLLGAAIAAQEEASLIGGNGLKRRTKKGRR